MKRAQLRQAVREAARTPAIEGTAHNRAQRRYQASRVDSRPMRRNIFGIGRWRRPLSVTTGRYDEPFAMDLGH